jgi:hypothetical protein
MRGASQAASASKGVIWISSSKFFSVNRLDSCGAVLEQEIPIQAHEASIWPNDGDMNSKARGEYPDFICVAKSKISNLVENLR